MKKLITLTALLLCAVVSTWADPVTIGITNTTTNSKSQATTETLTGSGDDITVSKLALSGSQALSEYSKGDKEIKDGTSTSVYSTHTYKWSLNTGTSIDDAYMNTSNPNEYVGFSFTVASGKAFSISGISAKLASSANHVFRIRIEDNSGKVLYTAAPKTINRTSDNEQNISGLNSTNAANIQSLSAGTYKVKAFLAFNSNGKYLVFTKLQVTGTLGDDSTPSYTMTAAVNNVDYGSASANSSSVLEGKSVTFTASSNLGYKFVNWTNTSTSTVVSSENPYTIASVSENISLTANFEPAHTISFTDYSTFYGTREDNNFTVAYADDNDKYAAPANLYLSSANQTLTGWNDGTKTYAVNEEIDCSAGDKTLSPVFTTNSGATFAETLDARTAGFTTTWNFGSNHAMFIMQNTTGYYVKQATINGASVDIPMFINTKPGKFNTEGDNTERAQINNGTILTIPVVDGSVVTLTGVYAFGTTDRNSNSCTQTTINGGTEYDLSNSNKTATYTYSGATGTIDIVVGGDMAWGTSLSVTYPSPYSVTYDGNGAEIGSVTDASTYDKNASVTTKNNKFVKTGYAFKEWNTEANGTGVSYFAGDKFTITDNTTLYAQWMEGTEATITYTLNVSDKENKDESTITSENASSSEQLNTLVGITNNTGGDYGTGDKANMTVKIPTEASYNADHYMSVGFTVANGYQFTPTTIIVKAQPVSTNKAVKLVLTDGVNSIDIEEEGVKQGVLSTIILSNASSTTFTGAVTLKIYCYGDDKTYRLGSPITITGAVAPATTTVRTNAGMWASFTPSWNATLEDGATAYIITGVDGDAITASTVGVLEAGEGYFVKGDAASKDYTATATSEAATATDDNLIVGCTEATNINAGGYAKYVLGTNGSGESGLFLVNSDVTVPAGKAYLQTKSDGARQFLSLDFDEVVTGIETVEAKKSLLDGEFFNLKGQRVAQPKKGLYIMNGKKVVLK